MWERYLGDPALMKDIPDVNNDATVCWIIIQESQYNKN